MAATGKGGAARGAAGFLFLLHLVAAIAG